MIGQVFVVVQSPGHAAFGQDLGLMTVQGVKRDPQGVGGFLRELALGQRPKDIPLAVGKARPDGITVRYIRR